MIAPLGIDEAIWEELAGRVPVQASEGGCVVRWAKKAARRGVRSTPYSSTPGCFLLQK